MSDLLRTSVPLNERQALRLREIAATLGHTQTSFLAACIDVLTDDEINNIMFRHFPIKNADKAAKVKARAAAKAAP